MCPGLYSIKDDCCYESDRMPISPNNSTRYWVRPGVIFWQGKKGSYIEDALSKRIQKINATAYFLLQLCNGRTVNQIIEEVHARFEGSSNAKVDIPMFISQLKNEGLLVETAPKNLLRRSDKRSFPLGLVFCELTYTCNLRCTTCYNFSGQPREDEMTTTEWKIALEKIANANPKNRPTVIFTGGEPLFRKDFFDLASYAKELGLYVQLFTNGTLIDNDVAIKISQMNLDYVRISVDGASSKTNDGIRGKGGFDKAVSAMKYLTENNVKVCWQSVISQSNFHELNKMIKLAISLGLDGFRASSLDPIGRGESIKSLCLSPKQELTLWTFMAKSALEYGNKIKIGWGADYCMEIDWNQILIEPRIKSPAELIEHPELLLNYVTNSMCGVGLRSCLITPAGFIALCPLLTAPELQMGHVLKDDFANVWANGKAFQVLRETPLEEFDECNSCGFRYSCLGGCRGLAYLLKGRLTACDPKRLGGYEYFASNFERSLSKMAMW